ncbi:hypothetical protein ESCO_003949 [Escovopsis weberi]|uniref:GPI-anchored cupredoxin n=1 Tax=Escovopsis weberi TaxID=150374 RepID=A0A0M8N117_ESCWE|nr:hypothetical protein ESCO_003949 [Escovopsis weberi]
MRSTSLRAASAALAMAMAASAAFIRVDVGKDGLVFTPDTIKPAKGDTVEFHFFGPNHTVTQGTFDNPCQPPKDGGFFSGFQPPSGSNTEADNVFQVMINNTDPLFVYCSQPVFSHCKSGMVLAINPSDSQTLDAYKKGAGSVDSAGIPDSVSSWALVAASKAQVTDDSKTGSSSSGSSGSSSASPSSGSGSSSSSGGGLYGGGGSSSSGSSEAGHIGASLSGVAALALGMAVLLL